MRECVCERMRECMCEREGGRDEVFDGVTEADTMFGRLVLFAEHTNNLTASSAPKARSSRVESNGRQCRRM